MIDFFFPPSESPAHPTNGTPLPPQTISTLSATIEDADARSAALDSALNILGEESSFTPAAAPVFLQESMTASSQLFLQARDPQRPLLDLITKCGKTSTVAALLRTALHASPSQVEAFQKIRGEIVG